jgi:hypothetical protein
MRDWASTLGTRPIAHNNGWSDDQPSLMFRRQSKHKYAKTYVFASLMRDWASTLGTSPIAHNNGWSDDQPSLTNVKA